MDGEMELDRSVCESELSAAYEGDVSLVESSASVEISEADLPLSEYETDIPSSQSHIVSSPRHRDSSSLHSTFRHGVRKPVSSTSGRSDLRRQAAFARLQAELIRANSKIVQLESELSHQRNLAEHAQIKGMDSHVSSYSEVNTSGAQVERLHQVCISTYILYICSRSRRGLAGV